MLDWLMIWGVTQAAGLVVKPILEDLTKETAKDFTKDFFKEPLKIDPCRSISDKYSRRDWGFSWDYPRI
jgi:hypothetical protein